MRTVLTSLFPLLALWPGWVAAADQPATNVQFSVTINSLPPALAPLESVIRTHITTAARMWTEHVEAKPCTVQISFAVRDVVEGDPKKLGFGKSTVTAPYLGERDGDKRIMEQGWASLLRTGRHPRGSQPDIQIEFQTAYVLREFWWDPDPASRTAPVPAGKLDAMTPMLHELGHALAFNGWLDQHTGKLAGNVMSTYDRQVHGDGRDFFFRGPTAAKVCGKPVLLGHTVNNYHHLGEERPGVAVDARLRDDLMTGYHFQFGRRYSISPLDIAILGDCGIPAKN